MASDAAPPLQRESWEVYTEDDRFWVRSSAGSSTTTGMRRVVFCAYLS
jgi:hypothetical protein